MTTDATFAATEQGDAGLGAYLDERVGPGSTVYLEPAEWDDAGTDAVRCHWWRLALPDHAPSS